MPDLEKTPSRRSGTSEATSEDTDAEDIRRIGSGRHLDDSSQYNSEILEEKDIEEAIAAGQDHIDEVRNGIRDERDIEAQPAPLQKYHTTRSVSDEFWVTWDGPDDPKNPKNWSFRRKWSATFVVSCFTFISPVSSSMVAPALRTIAAHFQVGNEVEMQLMLSIFVLGYAVGPLFLGPMSEIYGRVKVLQLANLFFLVFNIACAVCTSKGQMMAFRFLSGLGGSAPLAIGGGVLGDCWKPEERGMAVSVYSLAPLLGPAVGPIAGGFITEKTSWRWAFYSTSIADGLIQLGGLFLLQETYGPKILLQKAKVIRKETGDKRFKTEFEHSDRSLVNTLKRSLSRPFILLATQPIVQALSVYMAFIYGIMYLVISTFPTLWLNVYHENVGIGGLNYISLGFGFFVGAQACARMNDRIYVRLKKRNNNEGKPEFRVPMMFVGAALIPIGLFWYGWSAQARVHWIMPNIGAAIFAAGTIVSFQCLQTYIIDSYTKFAASAVAAATVLRSLAGFGFPLFAPYMYASLDYGWGNSLLAFIAIVLGIPAPFVLWKYGKALRGRSKFAAG